jgi:hypothetical protein
MASLARMDKEIIARLQLVSFDQWENGKNKSIKAMLDYLESLLRKIVWTKRGRESFFIDSKSLCSDEQVVSQIGTEDEQKRITHLS